MMMIISLVNISFLLRTTQIPTNTNSFTHGFQGFQLHLAVSFNPSERFLIHLIQHFQLSTIKTTINFNNISRERVDFIKTHFVTLSWITKHTEYSVDSEILTAVRDDDTECRKEGVGLNTLDSRESPTARESQP